MTQQIRSKPTLHVSDGMVSVFHSGSPGPLQMGEADACRALLAHAELMAACEALLARSRLALAIRKGLTGLGGGKLVEEIKAAEAAIAKANGVTP